MSFHRFPREIIQFFCCSGKLHPVEDELRAGLFSGNPESPVEFPFLWAIGCSCGPRIAEIETERVYLNRLIIMDEYELFRQGSRLLYGAGFSDASLQAEAFGGIIPGSDFGEYHIEKEICRGDTASVFEAAEGNTGRRYALKTLRDPAAAPPGAFEELQAEAAVTAGLRHPSLQRVLGKGEVDGVPYFLMTLHSGLNAGSLIEGRVELLEPGSFIELAARFASIADAVSALHRQGIVHRDINPSNILLDAEERFILTDFGSALQRADRNLRPGVEPAGELMYRSPQQLLAGANHYAPCGDIYALGMTLYALLAGRLPFSAGGAEELGKLKLTRDLPSLCRVNPRIPLGLDGIVRQACEIERTRRYGSAEDMARDLKRFVSCRRRSRSRYAS